MKEVKLLKGAHATRADGVCAMEFAAYLAGIEHTDQPECVSPVLRAFMVRWNDDLDDKTRQKLRPYISRTIGTAGDGQDEARRYMALDWLVRVHTPAFLAAAGLTDEADKLRGLAAIEGVEAASEAVGHLDAARDAAWAAARAVAWDAAGDAAGDAAWAAARAVAWDAARAAAGDAAWAAARAAAWAAAGDAAWDAAVGAAVGALHPTVETLQTSAFELLDRMIDPGGIHDIKTEAEFLSLGVEK